MNTTLLISLIILIAVIVFIVWWYGTGKTKSSNGASFGPPGGKDRLTLISGIGPTLERKLNELGITSFKQIAELTEEDIERVDRVLAFKGRIQREGWVAQARKLVETGSRSTLAGQATGPDKAARKAVKKKSGKKKVSVKKKASKSSEQKRH